MMRRRLIRLALGMLAGAVVIVGAANAVVALGGGGWTRDPAAARPAQAALVLGAQVHRDGSPSAMLEDRVRAAAALYRDRRVAKVLVSGDHGTVGYDEVGTMRRRLMSLGVPARDSSRTTRASTPGTAWCAPRRSSRSRPPSSSPSASTSPARCGSPAAPGCAPADWPLTLAATGRSRARCRRARSSPA